MVTVGSLYLHILIFTNYNPFRIDIDKGQYLKLGTTLEVALSTQYPVYVEHALDRTRLTPVEDIIKRHT